MITARFPIGYCAHCERDVMLQVRLNAAGTDLTHACVHCDNLPAERGNKKRVRHMGPQALRGLGYAFDGDPEPEPNEGCGKENCSKGQCKNSSKRHPFHDSTPL